MDIALEVLVILLLIAINGGFAMSELALVSARRGRLAMLEREGVRGAVRAAELAEHPQRFLPAVQIGITLVAIIEGTFGAARIASHIAAVIAPLPIIGSAADSLALTLMVVVITYLTLVVGELVPKQLALLWPDRIAANVAGPIAWFSRVTGPVVWVLGQSSGLLLRMLGAEYAARAGVTEEEVKALVAEGAQTGVFETEERDMIERVLRLADKPVRALMTPRTGIVWLDRTDPPAEIAQTLRSASHSRFVVCDGSIDNVVGVVAAKDVLDRIIDGGELSIAAVLRQPMVVPDTVTALDALDRLKADPVGMALVMDEYGTFEGVVTAADVLYAIVGDPGVQARTMGDVGGPAEATLELDGMTPVDEVKARLSLPDLPAEGSYHTLAGLLLALLRRVPQTGDRIVFGGWRFEVLAMHGRRVEQVRISREESPAG